MNSHWLEKWVEVANQGRNSWLARRGREKLQRFSFRFNYGYGMETSYFHDDFLGYYINQGDSYSTTLLWNVKTGKFELGCEADLIEEHETYMRENFDLAICPHCQGDNYYDYDDEYEHDDAGIPTIYICCQECRHDFEIRDPRGEHKGQMLFSFARENSSSDQVPF